jgi:hypothetical protein
MDAVTHAKHALAALQQAQDELDAAVREGLGLAPLTLQRISETRDSVFRDVKAYEAWLSQALASQQALLESLPPV